MIRGKGKEIIMTEGDYGITLPINIKGIDLEKNDVITIIIKSEKNGEECLCKTFSDIENNTFSFSLTEEESKKLTPRRYVYSLDWYRENSLFCNLIKDGTFVVEDKC